MSRAAGIGRPGCILRRTSSLSAAERWERRAAFHLARRGHGRVVLLERTSLAAGASGKSTAVVRQHYSNRIYARWAMLALKVFRNFGEVVGGDSGFIPCGYSVVVGPEDVAPLKANVALLQSLGVHTELLSAAQLSALQPHLYLDDVALAAIEPEAGCAEPRATVRALAAAAERHGAEIRQDEPVLEILREGTRVVGVRTPRVTFEAGLVVDAAGAFAVPLAQQVGYSCELKLVRHDIVLFKQPVGVPAQHMIISDRINVAYFRPKRGGLTLVGASEPTEGVVVVDPERRASWLLATRKSAIPGAWCRGSRLSTVSLRSTRPTRAAIT